MLQKRRTVQNFVTCRAAATRLHEVCAHCCTTISCRCKGMQAFHSDLRVSLLLLEQKLCCRVCLARRIESILQAPNYQHIICGL